MAPKRTNFTCIAPGCDAVAFAAKLCKAHYSRMRKYGSFDLPERCPMERRIWSRVDQSGGPEACWPWTGSIGAGGYGRTSMKTPVGRSAHRAVWFFVNGPIPDRMDILHRCDNPPCCNPNHLFPGTHQDNMIDCEMKGRRFHAAGEQHWKAKFCAEDIIKIRAEFSSGKSQTSIANAQGVNVKTISRIVRGESWKHLP